MADKHISQIDLDAVIAARAGKRVPKFIVNWLKRFIHQDYINGYLAKGDVGVPFCTGALEYLGVTVEVRGLENLPHDDRFYTFVSNHPLGAIDGITLGSVLGQTYDGNIKYLVNDLLMNLEGLAPLCVPVNKIGKQARNFPAVVEATFAAPQHVIMFPAGICSRRRNGEIKDLPWSKSFITKSKAHQRDIVPIHFIGENSKRFYRVTSLFDKLHMKFNPGMLFLPDEMYRSRGKHYVVCIGKPIPCETFDSSRSANDWAQWVREKVYEIEP